MQRERLDSKFRPYDKKSIWKILKITREKIVWYFCWKLFPPLIFAAVTVNKYSPKKSTPELLFYQWKSTSPVLITHGKRNKMLPCPGIFAACFSQYFIGSVFFQGKIYSLRKHSIAHWNFECFDNTIHCL